MIHNKGKKMRNKKTVNICFFSGDITRSGGTERVGSIIANELVKDKKYNILFLSLWEKKNETFFSLNEQIERSVLYDREINCAKHILGLIFKIHHFVKSKDIDILVDIDGILDMYSIPALIGTRTRLISWEQFNFYQNPYVNYRKITRKWAAKWADAIVVITKEDEEYYKKNLKIKHIIKQIYNPIVCDSAEFSYQSGSKIILSAGRLAEQKGFDILIDVAQKVFEKHPDWVWKIAGEGEQRNLLEQKIREYNLEKNVILCGNVNNIEEFYREASIYVLTSRYEGFGLVLTEAKTYGLPCVSFKCPAGPSEIILDKINGYLIDCFDINLMSDRICDLIENEELRKVFSEKSLKDTEKYSLKKVIKEWKDLIEEVYER